MARRKRRPAVSFPIKRNLPMERKSKRLQIAERKKGLDEDTIKRRVQKSIENLEKDNFLQDPHPDLVIPANYGTGEDSHVNRRSKRKKGNLERLKLAEYFKTRFAKTLPQLIEEDRLKNSDVPNYTTAQAPPPSKPSRNFCVVCGFFSKYSCTTCGAHYCTINCHQVHVDTRCLKWVI